LGKEVLAIELGKADVKKLKLYPGKNQRLGCVAQWQHGPTAIVEWDLGPKD